MSSARYARRRKQRQCFVENPALESARVITVDSAKKRFYRKERADREGKPYFS